MASSFSNIYQHSRTHVYVNCWYMGPHESYAMWRLYDPSGKGVAVWTTAGRLKKALQGTVPVHGAQVSYVDYDSTFIPERNVFFPYVHKRLCFAYETEYRLITHWGPKVLEKEGDVAVRTEPDEPPAFLREAVDLQQLIEKIYVSPDAPSWAARAVIDVVHRYLSSVKVEHSALAWIHRSGEGVG